MTLFFLIEKYSSPHHLLNHWYIHENKYFLFADSFLSLELFQGESLMLLMVWKNVEDSTLILKVWRQTTMEFLTAA